MGTVTAGRGTVDFAEWARPSVRAMRGLARRLAPDADPDDVVQESLTRAWQRFEQFDASRGTPTTWLLAIVADQARAARRSRLRRLRIVDDRTDVDDLDEPVAPPDADPDVDLERAIARLAERQQLAVHLHYFVGLTVDETAAVMACAPGTVKSTLYDARTRLRTLLGEDDD